MKPNEFFAQHAVFSAAEFAKAHNGAPASRDSALAYHEKHGHLLRVRRGLYVTVPAGTAPEQVPVDSYALTAKLAPDAVLAYHTALGFFGKAYSVHQRFEYLTASAARPFRFREQEFRPVQFPKALREAGQTLWGVKTSERSGVDLRVTSLERTLVDVLDRPDLSGGWEESWRSLASVEFFDLDRVVEYTVLLSGATIAAKVGLFLSQHREKLMVEESYLNALRKRKPRAPHYLEPGRRGESRDGKFLSEWNLIVPRDLAERTWEQVA
jgi:predicted transcriptional regulator of viral defense system